MASATTVPAVAASGPTATAGVDAGQRGRRSRHDQALLSQQEADGELDAAHDRAGEEACEPRGRAA